MPIERQQCDECGQGDIACPECGSQMVTTDSAQPERMVDDVVAYGGPEKMEFKNVCWGCGWGEEVTVTIERTEEDL